MIIQIQYSLCKISRLCIRLFLFCLAFTSCTEEESLYTPEITDGDALVRLTINTPSIAVPKVTTRSQTEDEAKIQEVVVMVFQDDKLQYQADGSILSSTVVSTMFNVTLKSTPDSLTLLLIANSNTAISSSGVLVNDSKATVKGKLNQVFAATGMQSPFPMYSEHALASLSANGSNDISGIKMLRAIARADVLVADEVTNFEMVSVQLFRTNNKIQIIPDIMVNAAVTTPSVPYDAVADIATSAFTVTGNKSELQLYFPESEAPVENDRISGATCIVIGGKYNGSNTTTYYRIDFNPGIVNHPFGQILRNHKYTFNIINVGIEGESTPEGAANAESTGITVEVESWDENSVDMWYEGEGYFSVSARTAFLRPWARTFKQSDQIKVNTSLSSYTIQWSDANGVPVGGSSPSTTSISNSNYAVSIINDVIQVEALSNNEQNPDRVDYFVIHAGKWDIVITINQYGLLKHMGDLIRVLSFSEIGDLGTGYADETTSAAALAMRQILNKQFCPTGVFKFGGYHFSELARLSTLTTLSPTLLSNFDVLLFHYNLQQNQTTSDNVMAWLKAKPNRVLIISADYTNTNINLLETAGDNLGWVYSTSGFSSAFDVVINSDTELFTQTGLFGSVAPGTSFNYGDATWGRATISNSQVIPLLTAENGQMVLGINKNKRIIYMGEIQSFYYRATGGLSGTTGAIDNDRDKFMANLWAWITETILSGK